MRGCRLVSVCCVVALHYLPHARVGVALAHPRMQLLLCVVGVCGSRPCWCGDLACAWIGVVCADASKVSAAAAGGVETIVQGMQAHVGVAGVQEHGAGALSTLAANGVLLHRLRWRCVVRGA